MYRANVLSKHYSPSEHTIELKFRVSITIIRAYAPMMSNAYSKH